MVSLGARSVIAEFDIAIIGAGIAGLAAAVACRNAGHEVAVFESAESVQPLGTSLSLWPNAMACLADWGLADEVATAGAPIDYLAMRHPDGRPLFQLDLRPVYQRLGHAGACVRRSDLQGAMMQTLPHSTLHLSHKLTALDTSAERPVLQFENGETHSARLVIAADGLHSTIRKQTLDDGPARYGGYGAWLGLSPAPAPEYARNEGCEYLGPNGRFGVFETGQDLRYWFYVSRKAHPNASAVAGDKDVLLRQLAGWDPVFRDLVTTTDATALPYVSFFDRPVGRTWGQGAVILIGDAMHPFLPNLGQGACQAIEDAHAIGQTLATGLHGADLRFAVQTRRYARARMFAKSSRNTGYFAQAQNAPMRLLRRAFYAGLPASLFTRNLEQMFRLSQ